MTESSRIPAIHGRPDDAFASGRPGGAGAPGKSRSAPGFPFRDVPVVSAPAEARGPEASARGRAGARA